jgi:hypothetical protein
VLCGNAFTDAGLTVPEPASLLLLGGGLAGIGIWRRKTARSSISRSVSKRPVLLMGLAFVFYQETE